LPRARGSCPFPESISEQAVYCLYTSGTSGRPKGVVVEHRGLVKRIQWLQDSFPLSPDDRVLHKTPYVFGISEWEFFWALAHGATLVLASAEGHKDPGYLGRTVKTQKVTVAFFVPSMLAMFLDHLESTGQEAEPSFKVLFTCGESLTEDVCRRFFARFEARLINLYGPTEADMTWWECPRLVEESQLGKVPIGRPISNTRAYILDGEHRPVPHGVPGELHFGGPATARGYLNRPAETASRFIDDPFSEGCLYRTGDLAQWLPNGEIEFLGRMDSQIKLRGYRIELGEIEAVLRLSKGVQNAVVLLRGDRPENHRLEAFVTPGSLDPEGVLRDARMKLPAYMVPTRLKAMEAFPLTERQKIDRSKFPDLASEGRVDSNEQEAETGTQKKIEQVWRDVLGAEQPLPIDEDFMALGGSSLLAGYATTQLRKVFGVHLPGTAIYTDGTIRKLSRVIDDLLGMSKAGPTRSAEPAAWGGDSPTGLSALLWQVGGVLFLPWTGQLSFYLVAFVLAWLVGQNQHPAWLVILVPVVMVLELTALAVLVLGAKRLLVGRLKPGRYPVFGSYYWRWWLTTHLEGSVTGLMESFFGGTVFFNGWLRLLGGRIGQRVLVDTALGSPELVSIGDDVIIDRHARIEPAAIENGWLILQPIRIGDGVRIGSRAFVVPGTDLPKGSFVGPLSSTREGSFSTDSNPRGGPVETRAIWHLCLGIPLLLLLVSLPILPEIWLLQWLYGLLFSVFGSAGVWLFWVSVPFVYLLVLTEIYFFLVVAVKRIVVGPFRPGPRSHTGWEDFRYWFMERLTHNALFQAAMEPWANSEWLAVKFRLLGAKIGRRVNMDYFDLVEHDLLSVGDHSVFGSSVSMIAADDDEALPIEMKAYSNVLDHCLIMPGVTVGEGALCGSSTLGPKGHTFPDHSISTGSRDGKCLLLKQRDGDAVKDTAGLSAGERRMIAAARRRHHSTPHWLGFNGWVLANVLFWAPLSEMAAIGVAAFWFFVSWPIGVMALLTPIIYLALNIMHAAVVLLVKRVVIGRYCEGNYPFYGRFHCRWVMMMSALHSLSPFLDYLHGTVFSAVFNRLMGARVGKKSCLMTDSLEADLLRVGDKVSVNRECDITCHTVENMVLKLAPVALGDQASLRSDSVVMPGGTMAKGSVLLEQSQVLKGETVGAGEVWSGLPAGPVGRWENEPTGDGRESG
ncbi:MAG: amino acid adenylation domain-containing protein, partial [Verrucomicrobiota bacterium]